MFAESETALAQLTAAAGGVEGPFDLKARGRTLVLIKVVVRLAVLLWTLLVMTASAHGAHLEAVIGLPAGLFYGTAIPACVLVMNKKDAAKRKHVFFVNADREYREGKAQNYLRPEDIAKIVHVYRNMQDGPGYARRVPVSEIVTEDYNCNIRRYVDNAPPPEPHDVRAHLHGGVPATEIEALDRFWSNYPGLRERVFVSRLGDPAYADFTPRSTIAVT